MRPYLLPAVVTFVLGLSDALLTIYLVGKGADEANPLMAWALAVGVWTFLVLKVGMHLAGSGILLAARQRYRVADYLLAFAFGAYAFGFMQHAFGLSLLTNQAS